MALAAGRRGDGAARRQGRVSAGGFGAALIASAPFLGFELRWLNSWLFQPRAGAVVRAFMTSKLDNCNVVVLRPSCAKVARAPAGGRSGPKRRLSSRGLHIVGLVLGDRGWLRVKHQLDLKIALMAYNAEYNVGSAWFISAAAFL